MRDESAAGDPALPGDAEVRWQPWPGRRWCYAAGALAALILAAWSDTGPVALGSGLALLVVAAVLAVLAALDFWYGTPLSAGASGLSVRVGPGRVRSIGWASVERIEATTTTRGLLRLASLEIDLGDQLLLLSRHRLGTDPVEVAVELRRRRLNGPRR